MLIEANDVVLFQGDSITDADRARDHQNADDPAGLGHGYVFHAAGLLHEALPGGKLAVHNRGIGGNRVTDLQRRWQIDTLDVRPNVLSVLIGVNDTWQGTGSGVPENGVPLDRYELVYRQILAEAKDRLPGLKLVLCEPFILPCGVVNNLWFPEFTKRREIVKKLAHEFGAVFVALQSVFDEALDRAAPEAWAADGVHPTLAGHMLLAKTWFETVSARASSHKPAMSALPPTADIAG
jgi:lysophospholipase L1-like esterase